MNCVRTRYAPSPTGSPHVGNLRTAVFAWLFARANGGQFVARLEDTDRDPERYRPEYIGDIESSLRFLEIEPDEWWVSGGPHGPYVQSERLALYQAAARRLVEEGSAYPCFCTAERLAEMRAQQHEKGLPPGYDRRCRRLSRDEAARRVAAGEPHTVRLAVPLEGRTACSDAVYGDISFENRTVDDQVLLKSNGWPTYHLAVVVDDHEMAITHVIRGEDWMPSTPKQVLLYRALAWEEPVWAHVPLILGPDRKKLSKRHGATQFVEFAREGYLPEAMFNFLVLLGWSAGDENRELFRREEIIERFGLSGISRNPAVFDYGKLRWMNGEYIRACPADRLADLCLPRLQEAGLVHTPPTPEEEGLVRQVTPLITDRMKVLSEAPALAGMFFRDPETPDDRARRKWLSAPDAARIVGAALEALPSEGGLGVEEAEAMVDRIAASLRVERAPVIHTLRAAATGTTVGPGLFETLSVLGPARLRRRWTKALDWIASETTSSA